MLLGFLSVYDSSDFFARGLLDGFKSADRPVTIWPETPAYKKGYHPYVDQVYSKLKASGAIYVPGFYLEAHPPMTIASRTALQMLKSAAPSRR